MAKYWIDNFLLNNVSEKNVQDFYNQYVQNFKAFKRYASHILVKKRSNAVNK